MRTLLLLRHAKSSHADDGTPDHDRPLTERGRRAAPRMGQLLVDRDLVPDTIISSSSQRTQETAELAAEECGFPHTIQYDERLYLATDRTILRVLAGLPSRVQRVMIVAHNPGLEDLIHRLTGRREAMPTAALAHIELSVDSWSELDARTRGTLRNSWQPRELAAED